MSAISLIRLASLSHMPSLSLSLSLSFITIFLDCSLKEHYINLFKRLFAWFFCYIKGSLYYVSQTSPSLNRLILIWGYSLNVVLNNVQDKNSQFVCSILFTWWYFFLFWCYHLNVKLYFYRLCFKENFAKENKF